MRLAISVLFALLVECRTKSGNGWMQTTIATGQCVFAIVAGGSAEWIAWPLTTLKCATASNVGRTPRIRHRRKRCQHVVTN